MKMKHILAGAAFLVASNLSMAQQLDLPKPSPTSTVEQVVGLTDFSITYSRPSVKGRTVFGDLVPYGEVWRTGANKSTLITSSTPFKFGETEVEAGTYALFVVPTEKSWTFILNSNTTLWGADGYDETENVASTSVKTEQAANVESMLIYFDNLQNNGAELVVHWSNVMARVAIGVNPEVQAEANIKKAIKGLDNAYSIFNSSAAYYLEEGKDPKQALEWAKKSVELKERFWNIKVLSEAYAANGMYKEAIETAEKSLQMAKDADYGPYIKMNEENIAKWKKM